jgi:SAM-dependent methyltransferase
MSFIQSVKLIVNFKLRFLRKSFGDKPFLLLDVGAGNHSATRITGLFPNCKYYGLDINKKYNNSEADFACMTGFYETDLTKLNYSHIPDAFFDGIWMAHVVEHLYNGDEVVAHLLPKLKPGGYFYIEYPGKKSLRLPSMRGTLNFHDDPTHVRVYSVPELKKIFEQGHCKVLSGGTRRNWYYIISIPLRAVLSLIKNRYVEGNVLWDILGFAEYLWVKKKDSNNNL